MYTKLTDLQRISRDCYLKNVTKYSQEDGEQIIRNAMVEILGEMPKNPIKFRRKFNAVQNEFFALVEELITINQNMLAEDAFGNFCEFKNYEFGEKPVYNVKETELFKVARISTGLGALRRQKLHGRKVPAEAFRLGLTVYEEFFDFITGKVNWTDTVDAVVKSFNRQFAEIISETLFSTYDTIHTNLKKSTNAVDADLREYLNRVEGAAGVKCAIYGTPSALGKITGAGALVDATDKREFGYVKVFEGRPCIELPQVYNKDTGVYEVPNDILLIIPNGEKIIKAGYEGDAFIVEDTDPSSREDNQIEFDYNRMAHCTVMMASVFGAIKITA